MNIKKEKILVVDDNPVNLGVLFEHLSKYNYTVLLVQSGEIALRSIASEKPDLILLDIMMPGLDGFEVCKRVKQNPLTANIPIIFMSALSDTDDKVSGFNVGGVDYITKPFQQEEVLARVKTHLEIKQLQSELKEMLDLERKRLEELRLNISSSLPHELRTPLTQIMGYSEMISSKEYGLPLDEIHQIGGEINKASHRLNRLIENYLLYANLMMIKTSACKTELYIEKDNVRIDTVAAATAHDLAHNYHREEDLKLDLLEGSITITYYNIQKIIFEIIDNAFKFSKPNTPVELKSSIDHGNYVIQVTDYGVGMTKKQIENIGAHMQFNRQVREQQGSGFGLINACLLMELEGGKIQINSEPNQQTTITLTFKLSSKP